jgi:hypothetical protein
LVRANCDECIAGTNKRFRYLISVRTLARRRLCETRRGCPDKMIVGC